MNPGTTHQPPTGPARVTDLFGAAAKHHQEGRLAEAEAGYRRVLAIEPGNADALNMLGIVALQSGRGDAAVELIREAIRRNATNPAYFHNLGIALRAHGKLGEAIAAARQAVALKPEMAEAHLSLGGYLHEEGKLEEAVAAYRQTIRFQPGLAQAHSNLGDALRRLRRPGEAAAASREALRLDPNQPAAHCHLGCALHDEGKLEGAAAEFRHAIRIMPDFAEAHCYLGNVLSKQGKLEEAIAATRRAIEIRPDYVEAHSNIAAMLHQLGRLDEAVAACREAIRIAPGYADAHYNLGCALFDQQKQVEAIAAWREAVRVKPDYREALANLGNGLRDLGKLEEAIVACHEAIRISPDNAAAHASLGAALSDQANLDGAFAAYQGAIRLKPDYSEASSALLACMNYSEGVSPTALFEAHRTWHERHGRQIERPLAHANDRNEGRRLKVGYVSPDFRGHSIAQFLEPLLRNHDRDAIEVFCYAQVSAPDAWTKRFEGLADHWVLTIAMSDDALAARIRRDGIDILVDLAGHTSKNRLMVFARKPAPVQVTWLGYPNSTGLEAIDYRLVDAVTDPPGEADALASEALVRLPGCFLCYGGPADAPTTTLAPCLATGAVTFGSFNNPAKLSRATLDAWAKLLLRLPQARLLLKGKPFSDASTRDLYLDRLTRRGVAASRLDLIAQLPDGKAHLALYNSIDIALDPFPYNGTTTTCEALWMGVPVVALRGDRHAGRVAASLLTHIGMSGLVADSVEDYVETAVALAADPTRLDELRHSLRPRMAASPLTDAADFARKIEHAYRTMWRRWCATHDAAEFGLKADP
jgi:predicted O-linked N-acetylglucosamine transferase (SPINDLY family)